MLIQLVVRTLHSENGGTGRKLMKLIQPVLTQLIGRTLRSDNGSTGPLSKITSSNLKKLIQPVLM